MMTPRKKQRERQNIRYWKELCDHLKSRGSRLRSLEPMKSDYKHYRDFQIGIPGFAVRAGQRRLKGTRIMCHIVGECKPRVLYDAELDDHPKEIKQMEKWMDRMTHWDFLAIPVMIALAVILLNHFGCSITGG